MRCPTCKRIAAVASIRYSQLGADNMLIPVNAAELTCGCVVPLADLPSSESPGQWEQAARRRLDDNLRSIFA